MPAHNMRTNSSTQPNSTDFGSNFANHPSGGTVSGFSSDTLIDVNSTPDHYWMNQRAQPISRRHYYAAQSGFHSMTPSSMIRRFDDRGAVDQCRLPDRHSYPGSEAGPLHIPSNVAIAGSSTTSTDSMNSHRQPTDVLSDHSPPASVVSGHCHAADVMGDHCHLTDAMSGHSEPTNAKSRNDISGHRQPTDAISQPANVVSDHRQPTDAVSDHRLLTNVVSSNVATAATSAQQGGTSSQVDQVCAHCGERDTNVPPNGKTLSDSSVTCQPTNVMSGHHQPFEIMNDPLQPTGIMSSHTQTADTMDDHYHSNVMNGHRHLTNHINDPLQRTNFTNGHRQSTNITNNHPHPASVLNGHYQPISDPLPQPTDIVNDHRPATNIMNDLLQPADSLNRGSSKPMTLDGGQTPGTFTPSRRNKVLNSRHIQARQSREEAAAREKLDRKFKFSRSSSNREFSITPAIHNGSSAEETIVDDGSSPATSHSPPRRRKRSARISTTTVLSSPTRSHRHGSDTSLGVHSSPIHRHLYSNTRRASSPGLFPNIHSRKKKRSYGQPTVDHRDAEHLAYPVHCPTESSADSEEDCHDNAAPGRNAECTCTACDDRTLLARIPSSAKRGTNIGHMPSQRLYHNHDSDPDTSPEHCSVDMQGCRHAKQRLLKVIETPKLTRKRRVVYLTSSSTPSSEEVYYSEPGQFVTPRSSNQRKRVFGVARGTSGSRQSVSRDKRSRMVRVRDAKQGKVYIEPATSTKRVYVMEQSGSDSETDLEQFDVLEVSILCRDV